MEFYKYIENKININKNQQFVAIIGSKPSKGARSPILWNRAYKKMKINRTMIPLDVKNNNLKKLINSLQKNKNFHGCSVTIPYKEKIMRYLDTIDISAKKIGSVNTIVKKNSKLYGYNTDLMGCNYSLDKLKKNPTFKKIIIIGCGGVGKACIVSVLKKFPKSNIYLFNRNYLKLKIFLKRFPKRKNIKILTNYIELEKLKFCDLLINATSLGFDFNIKEKNKIINLKYFTPISMIKFDKISNLDESYKNIIKKNILLTTKFFLRNPKIKVFDVIYNPKKTTLLEIADIFSIKNLNGLIMNLMQAVYAFNLSNTSKSINSIKKAMI